ncbi:MAG: sulfotransferase family protein [Flavimaricola sp.]|nr:sulfotransferase family protein [Flavimaricola sp.]
MTSALDRVGTDPTERLVGTALHNVNYLTHIDDVRKLAYIETPKVACTSIKKFMADQYVGRTFEVQDIGDIHNRDISPLKRFRRLPPEQGRSIWGPEYRRFSFVRNPFSRLLSGYLDKLVKNEFERQFHLPMLGFEPGSRPTLLEFLERLAAMPNDQRDIHFATQASLLMVDAVEYDFIGRFEGFKEDFLRLQRSHYGISHPSDAYESFGKHHASDANAKIERYYGPREIELVQDIYRSDFQLFGYSEEIALASNRHPEIRTSDLKEAARALSAARRQRARSLSARLQRLRIKGRKFI